ncbi:MAG: hypothetical protein IIY93_04205 [Clostridia bacterium]|nr:hypothetical protein [Clostridia bacterium]MBQ4396762.1 hypothetical protein [Clostridia bacterium]
MFFRNEIRKVLRFPLFWVMIAACTGFNIFLIADGMSYERIGIQAINEYVRTGNVPSYDEYNVCVNYDEVKESAYDQYYRDFDIMDFKSRVEKTFVDPNSDATQKIIDRNYQKAAARVDEIRQDGEALDSYYPGTTFSLHMYLYENVFMILLFELALISCFMTAYLMKYEEFYDTHQTVYATKVGRGIVFSKAAASAVASALAAVIVIAVSVTCFLIVLPQSWSFLQSSVSAAMATERRGMVQYPFITWERMSQLHYLLRACAVTVGYTVTASLVTFVLSFVSKNAYSNAVLTAMLYFSMFVAAAVLPGSNLFGFVLQFTPTVGMLNVSNWFMEYVFNPYASYPGYAEGVSVGWQLMAVAVTMPLWRYFKRIGIN